MMTITALVCLGPGGAGAFEIRQTPRRNPAADEVANRSQGLNLLLRARSITVAAVTRSECSHLATISSALRPM